jgi:hypothetical protein
MGSGIIAECQRKTSATAMGAHVRAVGGYSSESSGEAGER